LQIRQVYEGLNSSLVQSAEELQTCKGTCEPLDLDQLRRC